MEGFGRFEENQRDCKIILQVLLMCAASSGLVVEISIPIKFRARSKSSQ